MKKKSLFILLTVFLIVIAVTAVAGASADQAAQSTSSAVYWFSPFPVHGAQVDGARARLTTNESGATFQVQTSDLTEGNAYSVWWVIFNEPGECASTPCTVDDLGNGSVMAEITHATGNVIGASGKGNFGAHLQAGETPGGWFGNGFTKPTTAEIHVVVHEHGPMIPGLVNEMISTFRGGCVDDDESDTDAPYPPPAANDGSRGPNTCASVQFAIFQQ